MTNRKLFQLTSALALAGGVMILVICALAALPQTPRALSSPAAPAVGGLITVTTTLDEYDHSPNGTCSLREAVESINTSSSFGGCTNPGNAADTVVLLAETYVLTIPRGSLDINESGSVAIFTNTITISGMSPTQTIVEAGPSLNDRVFYASLPDYSYLTFENMTIRNGYAPYGAGMYVIYGWPSDVTLENLILEDNNVYAEVGGGALLFGNQPATTTINNVIVRNNQAQAGGGLFIDVRESAATGGSTTLTDVLIEGNTATSSGGGGIYINNHAHFYNVTITDNGAASSGGGLYFDGEYAADVLQLLNVTIYSNTAQVSGGGIYLNHGYSGTISATNTTIASNWVSGTGGGNIYTSIGSMSMFNTIVADGSPNNCSGNPLAHITSFDYNLDTDSTCLLTETNDIHPSVAGLDSAMADNGGRTPTLALMPTSPAVDGGKCSGAPPLDQRGVTRPQGPLSLCDIGAFEFNQWNAIYLPLVLRNP